MRPVSGRAGRQIACRSWRVRRNVSTQVRPRRTRSGCPSRVAARSGRSRCPSRARTRCWSAPCAPASAGAPRRWCSGAACRRASTPRCGRRSRRATSRGRSSTATSTSAWSSRARRSCAAAPCSACTRTRPPTSCRPSAVVVVPDDVPPARAVLAGTVETAVNALWDAAPLLGDRVTVVGAGMVGCCVARLLAPVPGVAGHAGRRRCRPGRGRRRARRRLRAAGRRGRRPRPGRARQRDVRRAAAVAGPARARGHGHRAQLVRRPRGPAVAGRRVPLRPARHPRQPGRHASPRPAAGAARPPTGWRSRWSCCATPPSTRCSPGSPASTSCPR